MRLIVLALLLALVLGTAQAVPLQGSDGNATVVLFGATRTPLDDENATEEILKVDVGLVGTENATYELLDQNDKTYSPGLYKTLQPALGGLPGRQLVYFLIPKDDLFKLIKVTPKGGLPFAINWWATPKGFNENVIIRYYGITDWLINPDEQGIVMQLRAANNGTKDIYLTPENFTLLDQWGWPYRPTAGFDPEVIGPGMASETRVLVGFTGVSLISRPAALAYNFGAPDQIIINLENDMVALSDEKVYGANATKTVSASAPATENATALGGSQSQVQAASAEDQTNQTKTTNTTTKLSSLKEKIAASKARLAGTQASLHESTKNESQNSTA
ncbi:MAG: hypothetical protein QUS07_07870 [Methanothrix sp.]|nr:hypothetical protein [Methanothrix sp.]